MSCTSGNPSDALGDTGTDTNSTIFELQPDAARDLIRLASPPSMRVSNESGAAVEARNVAHEWPVDGVHLVWDMEPPIEWGPAFEVGPVGVATLSTPVLPDRVSWWLYGELGDDGLPNGRADATDECWWPFGDCSVRSSSGALEVTIPIPSADLGLLVVQIEWPAETTGASATIARASWALLART